MATMVRVTRIRGFSFGSVRRALVLVVILCGTPPARGTAAEIGHPNDFCAQIYALPPGGEVVPKREHRVLAFLVGRAHLTPRQHSRELVCHRA